MDNVTHALAGLLIAEAAVSVVERRAGHPASPGFRRAALLVGVVAAELPDADLLYSNGVLGIGKLGYLLHHRGHTHTVLFALVAAVVIWAVAVALRRGRPPAPERSALLGVALVGTISHIALDFTNSYGIHPFWPIENSWYYGDAVFIVEPWLWIAGLAPLLLLARGMTGRVVSGLLLVGIIAAAWRVGQVAPSIALALTIGAALWVALLAAMPRGRRIVLALVAWCVIEVVFFTSSFAARQAVRMATTVAYRDAVLTPAIGDPFCVNALVVELEGGAYRVTSATVAPFPAVRALDGCAPPSALAAIGGASVGRVGTTGVRWGAAWSAPHAELVALAAENCEVAAALRFIRVPVWRTRPDGDVHLADLRYGGNGNGFADLVTPRRVADCPRFIPPWNPPRADILGEPVIALDRDPE